MAGRRRTAAANTFPTDVRGVQRPGEVGPLQSPKVVPAPWHHPLWKRNVWTTILKFSLRSSRDEEEHFIHSFISNFIIGEKPWFEVIDSRDARKAGTWIEKIPI